MQNEAADLLANNEYKVEMLDEIPGGNGYVISAVHLPVKASETATASSKNTVNRKKSWSQHK